ncbi:MAG: four helix bundle protein [Bacteroidia bacterium]|nr:four helix bundle protein [Bacteroidia bacterium]
MGESKYIELENLEVYKAALRLSEIAWAVFQRLPRHLQFSIGDQFIRSSDSIGANIAEAYGRYSYLDRIRILYIARGSYFESCKHWLQLLEKRSLISREHFQDYKATGKNLEYKLNRWIKSLRELKKDL